MTTIYTCAGRVCGGESNPLCEVPCLFVRTVDGGQRERERDGCGGGDARHRRCCHFYPFLFEGFQRYEYEYECKMGWF